MFFGMKTNLIDAQKQIENIIESYSDALNHDYSPMLLQKTAALFEYRKIKAIEKVSGIISNSCSESITARSSIQSNRHFEGIEEISADLEDECGIVLDEINKCRKEIKVAFLEHSDFLFHASSVLELKCIKASKNRLNAYRNGIHNSIFACSDFSAIMQFILRSASGSMYVLHNDIVILPQNPSQAIKNGVLRLARPVALYSLNASHFYPVIDFRELNGKHYIFFCGEWHAPTALLRCNEELFETISMDYYEKCSVFYYNGTDMDAFDNICMRYASVSSKEKLLCDISSNMDFSNLI